MQIIEKLEEHLGRIFLIRNPQNSLYLHWSYQISAWNSDTYQSGPNPTLPKLLWYSASRSGCIMPGLAEGVEKQYITRPHLQRALSTFGLGCRMGRDYLKTSIVATREMWTGKGTEYLLEGNYPGCESRFPRPWRDWSPLGSTYLP